MAGINRVVVLTDEEWSALQAIAGQYGCVSGTGRTTGLPSVNQLLRLMANGEVNLTRPAQKDKQVGCILVWTGRWRLDDFGRRLLSKLSGWGLPQ